MSTIKEASPRPWRLKLRMASFRQAPFHVEVGGMASGRRIALHEYPKKSDPPNYSEDMGRRTRTFDITAYLIEDDKRLGTDYRQPRDRLIAALDKEPPGLLIHPTLPELMVVCERYSVVENRERGGYCVFEMHFIEAGQAARAEGTDNTQAQVQQQAASAEQQSSDAFNRTMEGYLGDWTGTPGGFGGDNPTPGGSTTPPAYGEGGTPTNNNPPYGE